MAAANQSTATNPLFTVTFDVESSENYGDFIAGIRRRLANPKHFSRNRPVLPPEDQADPPRRWFHIVLRTPQAGAAGLTLATRADNLYLEGFRSRDGRWWELTRGYVPGATDLGFGGSTYRNLLGDTDRLADLALGPQQMADAVNALAAHTRADLDSAPAIKRTKDALAVLLLMVHEAARLLTVSGLVAGLMHPRAATKWSTITAEMKKQVNGWTPLSKAMLMADARPPEPFTPFKAMGVNTVEQAAATVGILKFVEVPGGMTRATALNLFHESTGH